MTRDSLLYNVAVLGLLVSCSAANLAAKPLPSNEDAFTDRQFRSGAAAYHLNRVDDYRRLTTDPEAVQDRAADYIGEVTRQVWTGRDKTVWKGLCDQGRTLREEGAADPLVISAYAWALNRNGETRKELAAWEEVLQGFKASSYPAAWQLNAAMQLVRRARDRDLSQFNRAIQFVPQLALASMKAERDPANLRYVWFDLTNFFDLAKIDLRKELWESVDSAEHVHPWFKHMVSGLHHIRLAWDLRGGGFASSVTPEGWKGFFANMEIAEGDLNEAYKLLPAYPEPAHRMIGLAMATDTELSPREWFDRAVAAQFDYMPAYHSLLFSMSPRWGGTHAGMLAFGKECAATKRFDTKVPWMLITVIEATGHEIREMQDYPNSPALRPSQAEEIWEREGHYPLVRPVLLGYAAEPNSPLEKRTVQTHHLWMAVNAAKLGDTPEMVEARELADALGDDYSPEVLLSRGARPKFLVSRIYAMTGSAAPDCRRADAMIFPIDRRNTPGVRRQAFDLYEQSEEKTADPRAAVYFRARKSELEWDIKLESGDWVGVTFDPEFALWHHHAGDWTWEDARTLVGESKSSGSLSLRLNVFSRPPLEFEFDLEQLPTSGKQVPLGLRMGRIPGFQDATLRGRVFWVDSGRGEMGIVDCLGQPNRYYPMPKNKKVHLHIRAWPDQHEFYVDGKPCEHAPNTQFDAAPPYVLGNMTWLVGGGKVRFSNLRIRKLAYGPPPAFEDSASRVTYFTRFLEEFPHYQRPRYLRGVAYYYQKEYDKALADLQAVAEQGSDETWLNLWIGAVWLDKDDHAKALPHLQKQVAATPDNPVALRVLAQVYATCPQAALRDGKKAVELAEAARRLTPKPDWELLIVLAAAYAEAGDFEKAIPLAKQALDSAPEEQKEQLTKRVAVIEGHQPYHAKAKPAEQDPSRGEEERP